MLCPIKVNSNTIELTVQTSCYCVLDLLCVKPTLVFQQTKVSSKLKLLKFCEKFGLWIVRLSLEFSYITRV